jgi:hypothetical protein
LAAIEKVGPANQMRAQFLKVNQTWNGEKAVAALQALTLQ